MISASIIGASGTRYGVWIKMLFLAPVIILMKAILTSSFSDSGPLDTICTGISPIFALKAYFID